MHNTISTEKMEETNLDYVSDLEDEIALEGLDGITLEALWLRLSQRSGFTSSMPLDEDSKSFLWNLIVRDEEIYFYELPEPRKPLVIFNRYQHMDPELGMVLEPQEQPEEIYPFHSIDDEKAGMRGSCHTYYTRRDVTPVIGNLSYGEAKEQYGDKLVLVGSQMLRDRALGIDTIIDKFYDLTTTQYVVLERIGRSRRMGEITQGKISLATMGENPKSMFYHRKRLLKLNLITKQPHQQKGSKGQTSNGSLLHLSRFYVERRSKFMVMIQRAVEILKDKPSFHAPYTVVKEEMGMPDISCRKLFKSSEFQRFIKFVMAPYRKVYPNAPPGQWRCKGKDAEKLIRIMELINPDMEASDVCKGEEVADDDEEDDESYPGVLDQSKIVWGVGLLAQAYKVVEDAGPEGVSQTDMAKLLGQTKLDSRTICRNLQRRNTVHSLMKDVGRQRVSRYVSHKFALTGHMTQEFRKERQKMMAMMEENQSQSFPSASKDETKTVLQSDSLEGVEVGLEMVPQKPLSTIVPSTSSHDNTSDDPNQPKDKIKKMNNLMDEIRLTYSNQRRCSPHVTTRVMKRANMIIESVRLYKVIDDALRLQKMIIQDETEKGYPVKMDKKSLNRLLDKLSKGGFLKNIIVKLSCGEKTKRVQFVVHPSISFDSPHLKAAIEQQKLKFLAAGHEPKCEPDLSNALAEGKSKETEETDVAKTVGESMQELKKMHQGVVSLPQQLPAKRPVGTKGGLGPKFIRMQELHKLLFFLVYGYSGQENLDQGDAWQTIANSSPEIQLEAEELYAYPLVYTPEISWRMFIPPLPNHLIDVPGWSFVCDILLRLPLCIFVRLVNVQHRLTEVDELLEHPLKRFFLVKYLPPHIRHSLLQGRRYVTYVIELMNRLCYIGLLQYGHHIMKEKDQVFIYVNRKASLIDTTTSSPGYHQISTEKEYVRKEYIFNSQQDVDQYWYDMWTICMHTPLGGHNCMEGKKITMEILDRKPDIIRSLDPRDTEEAPERDIGMIPGDGRGAAGLDSALFSHLKRNWSSSIQISSLVHSNIPTPTTEGSSKVTYEGTMSYNQYLINTTEPSTDSNTPKHRLAGLQNARLSVYKPKPGSDGKVMDIHMGLVSGFTRKGKKRSRDASQSSDSDVSPDKNKKGSKHKRPTSYQRELKMRKKSPKKPYYDEQDRAALRRMNKLRVDWSPAEDSFLLLCKVASCFMIPNKRSQMINFSLIRDMLHQRFPEARNKTSRACQRRINYIMKNPTTQDNVAIFLEEVKQDNSISKEFGGIKAPRSRKNIESVYNCKFRALVDCLVAKFRTSTESRKYPSLPDSLEEFQQKYHIIHAKTSLGDRSQFKEVASTSDIDFYVVNSLIYSSLCSKHDRDSYAYQLYLAYQQYPQFLLNSVLTSMRSDQMISYKKRYNRSVFAKSCLPLSTSPFQLSVSYQYIFNTKYQYEIFGQSWIMMKQLYENYLKNEGTKKLKKEPGVAENLNEDQTVPIQIRHEGGFCAAIVALMATKKLIFRITIPEQIIIMDQQGFTDDQQKSILKRFSSHSQMAGRAMPPSLDGLESRVADVGNKTTSTHIVRERLREGPPENNKRKNEVSSGEQEKPSLEMKKKGPGRPLRGCKKLKTSDGEEHGSVDDTSISNQEECVTRETALSGLDSLGDGEASADTTSVGKMHNIPESENEDSNAVMDTDSNLQPDVSSTEEDAESSSNQVKQTASSSRLGLYMMRDQLTRDDVDQINLQHAQDNFVVNACEISCQLKLPPDLSQYTEDDPEMELQDILMPLPRTTINKALEKRRKVILEKWSKLEDVVTRWKTDGVSEDVLNKTTEVYNFISSHKELGASVKNLRNQFNNDSSKEDIIKLVVQMEEENLILRVGVAVIRWVTYGHSKPWLIHTNKMTKRERQNLCVQGVYKIDSNPQDKGEGSQEKVNDMSKKIVELEQADRDETAQDVPSGKVDMKEEVGKKSPQKKGKKRVGCEEQKTKKELIKNIKKENVEGPQPEQDTPDYPAPLEKMDTDKEIKTEKKTSPRKSNRLRKKKGLPTEQEDLVSTEVVNPRIRSQYAMRSKNYCADKEASIQMEKTAREVDDSEYQQISVSVCPWVRLCGLLNRRVLDRLLGSVLSFIMERPGVSGNDIAKRFSPALQPAHTFLLLETLVTIKCVTRLCLMHSHKPSLFSKPVDFDLVEVEPWNCDADLLYEPLVDAVLKLSMFIGDKKYSQDFLSGERR